MEGRPWDSQHLFSMFIANPFWHQPFHGLTGFDIFGGPILIHPLLKNVPCHLWLRRTVETQCAAWSLQPCRLHWQCHGRLGPWGDSLLCCRGRRKWPRQGIWPAFGSLGLPPSTRSQWIVMGGPLSKIRRSWYILVVTGIVGEGGKMDPKS